MESDVVVPLWVTDPKLTLPVDQGQDSLPHLKLRSPLVVPTEKQSGDKPLNDGDEGIDHNQLPDFLSNQSACTASLYDTDHILPSEGAVLNICSTWGVTTPGDQAGSCSSLTLCFVKNP